MIAPSPLLVAMPRASRMTRFVHTAVSAASWSFQVSSDHGILPRFMLEQISKKTEFKALKAVL